MGGRRDLIAAMVGALLAGALGAPPTAAADPPALELAGDTYALLLVDLDDDGDRELLRLTGTWDAPEVEAWTHRAAWRSQSAAVPRGSTAASRLLSREAMVTLVELRRGGTSGALLVIGGPNDEGGWASCCLKAWWIDLVDGRIIVEFRGALPDHAVSVSAFDGDADGTDEIVLVNEGEDPARTRATVLRHDDDRFEALAVLPVAGGHGVTQGVETDGRPGQELLFGPSETGVLQRVTLDAAGAPSVEAVQMPPAGDSPDAYTWLAAVLGDRLVLQSDPGLMLAHWPSGQALGVIRTVRDTWIHTQMSRPNGDPLVLVSDGSSRLRVIDASGNLGPRTPAGIIGAQPGWMESLNASGVLDNAQLYPHYGEIPGGLGDDVAAAVIDGHLVTVDPSGTIRADAAGRMAGIIPVGTLGPNQAWLAVAGTPWYPPSGGWMTGLQTHVGSILVAPVASILEPSGALEPRIDVAGDAVVVAPDVLATGGTSVLLELAAPVGSRVLVIVNGFLVSNEKMQAERETRIAQPRRLAPETDRFLVTVGVVTPLGAVSVETWQVRLMHDPPAVDLTDATRPWELASQVRGTAPGAAIVTVDGVEVPVAPDGTFAAEVFAPPWPRDVLVSATDVVGNRSVAAISAIGLYDYRWVPFPILVAVGLGTLLVALFVTAGRRRPQAVPGGSNPGTWEELDPGTLIVRGDGPEPPARLGRRRW